MRWIKLHTTLHRHIAFRRLTPGARLVFYVALELAGDLEQDGALFVRGGGPLTVAEIALEVGVTEAHTQKGLEQLVAIGFMAQRADGAFVIEKWDEKTAPDPSTERVKRHRERKRNVSRNALPERGGNRAEEEVEEEIDTTPNGVETPPSPTMPKPCLCAGTASIAIADDTPTESIAETFLGVFLNCKTPTTKAKHRAKVVGWLREMRDERFTWRQILTAAARVHADGDHAPIWQSGPVWNALRTAGGKKFDAVDISGGTNYAAVAAERGVTL